jgi:hypothetical protein
MAIDMGGIKRAPMDLPPHPRADKVTITPAQGGGFAVECQRDGGVETSVLPDFNATLDYVASELGGGEQAQPEMSMGPPEEMA